jgi:hypothetical protein
LEEVVPWDGGRGDGERAGWVVGQFTVEIDGVVP